MSWIDKIKDKFILTCGDGEVFEPSWMNAQKEKEYNIARFAFPDVPGELVKRGEQLATSYSLELYFQGPDHLDTAQRFDISSNDKRAWTISHPYYGSLYVQPLGITFDNTQHNVSKILCTVVETINEDNPQAVVYTSEQILMMKNFADSRCITAAYEDAVPFEATTKTNLQETTYNFYQKGRSIIKDTADEEKYTNIYNEVYTAIVDATSSAEDIMRKTQSFINAPFIFNQSVKERQNMLVQQLRDLFYISSDGTLPSLFPNLTSIIMKNMEVMGSAIISSMAAIITAAKDTDFTSRTDVLEFIDVLANSYSSFVTSLDNIQLLPNGAGFAGVFLPDSYSQSLLRDMVNFVLANTFNLLQNSKQERTILLEDNSSAILLCHRFYGLNQDDSTLEKFIELNNIGLSEIFFLRKGRKIIYYVV